MSQSGSFTVAGVTNSSDSCATGVQLTSASVDLDVMNPRSTADPAMAVSTSGFGANR